MKLSFAACSSRIAFTYRRRSIIGKVILKRLTKAVF